MSRIRQLLSKASRGIKFGGKTKIRVAEKIQETFQQTGVDQFIALIGILHDLSVSNEFSYLSTIGYDQKVQASDMQRLNGVLDL
jgi:hypothetical protein